MAYPDAVVQLIEAFRRSPGIGAVTAERLAFHVLRDPLARELERELVRRHAVRSCALQHLFDRRADPPDALDADALNVLAPLSTPIEARGPVGDALVADGALDEDLAGALWRASEELVGEPFTITVG